MRVPIKVKNIQDDQVLKPGDRVRCTEGGSRNGATGVVMPGRDFEATDRGPVPIKLDKKFAHLGRAGVLFTKPFWLEKI